MPLVPILNRQEIKLAFEKLSSSLKEGALPFHRQQVGWPSSKGNFTVYWHAKEGIWSVHNSWQARNRYWCAYGTEKPIRTRCISISCEANQPFSGFDRRIAGGFMRDDTGAVYVTNSGKVGGGRKGVGKSAFLSFWRGENIEPVHWPDGKVTRAIVIGRIGEERLVPKPAHFVREVDRFKKSVKSGKWSRSLETRKHKYTPEFTGKRKGYSTKSQIQAHTNHGLIVDALRESWKIRVCESQMINSEIYMSWLGGRGLNIFLRLKQIPIPQVSIRASGRSFITLLFTDRVLSLSWSYRAS